MSYEKIRKNAKGGKLIPKFLFGNKIGDRLGTSVWDGQRWVDEETFLQEGRNAASGTNTAIDSMATTKVVANTSNILLQDNGQITGGTIDLVDNNGNIVKSDAIDGKDAAAGGNNAKNAEAAEAAKAISGKGGMNVPTGMIGDAAIALNNAIDDAAMGDKNFSASSQALDKGVDAAASMASKFGPWGLLCVCEGTKVITNSGEEKNIEDLKIEDGILGYANGKIIQQKIEELFEPSYKKCVQIETHGGNILRCSIDHPIYSAKPGRAERIHNKNRHRVKHFEFKEAGLLKVDDYVAEAGEVPFFGDKSVKLAYLLGLLIGDGTYGGNRGKAPILFTGDPCTWKYLEDHNLGKLTTVHIPGDKYNKEFREYTFHKFLGILREYGIYGQTKSGKRLPINLYKWDKQSCAELLAGLFDTDGFVVGTNCKNSAICFTQSNLELIMQVKYLLIRFGIHSTIIKTFPKISQIKGKNVYSKGGYVLRIKSAESIQAFYNNIQLNIDYKQRALQLAYLYKSKILSRDNSLKYHNIHSDKIKNIIDLGYCLVYNLRVGDSHTYLANNIITHNTAGILKTLNSASKYGGQNVLGYDVNINNSGYGTMGHMESEAGRVWDKWSGATARKLAKRNEQAKMALTAMDISEDTKYEQEARTNSVTNVLQQNQIALAGGIDTSLLGS